MVPPSAPRIVLACMTWRDGGLALLVSTASGGVLPSAPLPAAQDPDQALEALARRTCGRLPAWRSQVGAIKDGAALTIVYAAALPAGTEPAAGTTWRALPRGGGSAAVRATLAHLRARIDREPVAFRLLGPVFTLSDLQQVYELLLERRLHKASFRRALLAAHLVEPTDAWRSEGRGRPAQLFRYAPRRRRGLVRAVRFDLLG